MSRLIEKKKISGSKRGLTFSFSATQGSDFGVGATYKYVVDKASRTVRIYPASLQESLQVSRKKVSSKVKSLIDLRSRAVRELSSKAQSMTLYIYKDKIVCKIEEGKEEEYTEISREVLKVYELPFVVDNASLDFLDALKVINMYCGGGLFEYGFTKDHPYKVVFAIDYNEAAMKNYRNNFDCENAVCQSVYDYNPKDLPSANIFIGTPSCSPFSTARCNKREDNIDSHFESKNLDSYIEWVTDTFNNKYDVAILENVPSFATDLGGRYLKKLLDGVNGYFSDISYGVVKNELLGGYSKRSRFICIMSNIGSIPIPNDIVKEPSTVRDAFSKITRRWKNYDHVTTNSELVRKRMSFIRPGSNHKDLPLELKTKGVHSNSYRRLEYDSVSCTLVNTRKTLCIHPRENRGLSVSEMLALQGVEEDYHLIGGLSAMQQIVANGVPVQISAEIGERVFQRIKEFYSPYKYVSI